MARQGSLLARLFRWDAPPEEPLLWEVRAGGATFQRLVLTRNRRVMISVGDGGTTLRVHEGFRDAPAEVWRSIGQMYAPGADARTRDRARERVLRYLRDAPPVAARGRPRRIPAADRPHLERLQAEFDRVNRDHFQGTLPRVPLALSGRMSRRNGHFSTAPLEIVLSRRLCTHAVPGEAERTLRHEMIHLWQHVRGAKPDHGREFRRWAERLDIHPRATRTVEWKEAC